MGEALEAFAAHADPSGTKLLVLVVDNAGWHRAKRLAVPANVRLHFLPPCTPELQPVEPFWALVREAVANDTFDRLADLRRRVARRGRRAGGRPRGGAPPVPAAGRRPGDRPGCDRVPLGGQPGGIRIQRKTV